jgi:hypothetical protein
VRARWPPPPPPPPGPWSGDSQARYWRSPALRRALAAMRAAAQPPHSPGKPSHCHTSARQAVAVARAAHAVSTNQSAVEQPGNRTQGVPQEIGACAPEQRHIRTGLRTWYELRAAHCAFCASVAQVAPPQMQRSPRRMEEGTSTLRKGQLNRHTRYRPATTTRNTATQWSRRSVD